MSVNSKGGTAEEIPTQSLAFFPRTMSLHGAIYSR
jgi:hypothetical protein